MEALRHINRNVVFFLVSDSFYYAGDNIVNAFLVLLISLKVAPDRLDLAGYAIAYYMIVRSLSELPLSYFAKRLGPAARPMVVTVAYLLHGMLLVVMGFAGDITQVFLLQTLIAMLDALAYPIRWTLFCNILDRGNEELEWGLEDVLANASPAVAASVAGILATIYGPSAALFFAGPFYMLSGLAFLGIRQLGPVVAVVPKQRPRLRSAKVAKMVRASLIKKA